MVDEAAEKERILVVEDDPVLANLMSLVLADAGYLADTVETPEAAHGTYDLVVSDYLEPVYQRGHTWPQLDQLQRLSGGKPIVGCTAHPEATEEPADDLGVAAVVIKPFDIDAFVETVRRLLDAPGAAAFAAR